MLNWPLAHAVALDVVKWKVPVVATKLAESSIAKLVAECAVPF
jgi:hypothetical protein